nr:MAG TPA: hypothetical protein [Caudoviricetes sp.]
MVHSHPFFFIDTENHPKAATLGCSHGHSYFF